VTSFKGAPAAPEGAAAGGAPPPVAGAPASLRFAAEALAGALLRRAWIALLWVVVAAGALHLGHEVRAEAHRYRVVDSAWAFALVPLRWLAIGAAGAALLGAALVARRWWPPRAAPAALGLPLRGCLYALLAAFAAGSVSHALGGAEWTRFAVRSVFSSALLAALALWLLLLALRPDALFRAPRGAAAWLDAGLLNGLLLLAFVELGLALYSRMRPSQILWDEDSVESEVASRRLAPATLHHGFRVNRLGFPDEEFRAREPGDFVAALLADSFGLGTVHHHHHFSTVAERRLAAALARPGRRVAVDNYGVTGIGMSGYAWLLEHEVLPADPSLVVLHVFVGNDISGFDRHRYQYFCLQYLRLYKTLRRLLALRREADAGGRVESFGPTAREERQRPPRADEELPTFSEEAYLGLELERAERCDPSHPKTQRHFRGFFEALAFFQERLGDRLLVVLAPDEYQVDDALWAALLARAGDPGAYQRDYPQQRIAAFCAERGIALLDLLPPLREAQRRERVYHLRDTHWNAGGNRVAGEALADFILERWLPGQAAAGRADAARWPPQPRRSRAGSSGRRGGSRAPRGRDLRARASGPAPGCRARARSAAGAPAARA
jgi:hypothetical protein